jgi:hypothetical protein
MEKRFPDTQLKFLDHKYIIKVKVIRKIHPKTGHEGPKGE